MWPGTGSNLRPSDFQSDAVGRIGSAVTRRSVGVSVTSGHLREHHTKAASDSCPAESSCRKGNLHFLCAPCCIRQSLGDVFSGDIRIGSQDLFSGFPRSDQSDEGSDGHPGALDARFAGHNGWIPGDAIKLVHRASVRLGTSAIKKCGQGRGRTVDLPIFSRTLVPTELPGRTVSLVG